MVTNARESDFEGIIALDHHISKDILAKKIDNKEVYIVKENEIVIGTLRYSLFWDNTPFMNLLYISKEYQRKGYGTLLVSHWENDMISKGFKIVMTSTLANEEAQHFYRKNGYKDIGGFVLPDEPLELLFIKEISV
jgi:GNAT superfamily N-acetyltransferase